MTENEAKQRLIEVNAAIDAILLDSRRELRTAEGRLTDAGGEAQDRLDGIAVPEQFNVRAFASGAVGVLEAYAEYRAALARRQQMEALAQRLA